MKGNGGGNGGGNVRDDVSNVGSSEALNGDNPDEMEDDERDLNLKSGRNRRIRMDRGGIDMKSWWEQVGIRVDTGSTEWMKWLQMTEKAAKNEMEVR